MTKAIIRSVCVALVLATGGLAVSDVQAQQPKNSPALGETFTAIQNALNARRYAEVMTKSREVLAGSRKTPDDVYLAHYFMLKAAEGQKDNAGMIAAMEGMLESGFSPGAATQNQFRKALASAYYQQKNFAQTIKYGNELIRAGAADEDVYTVVGQSYFQTRNYDESIKLFGGLVSNAEKANRRPDRRQLILLQNSYEGKGDKVAAQATLEKVVRHYPTADTWMALLYDLKAERLDPRQKLHMFRLMQSTGNLKHPPDFIAYSEAATSLGLVAEARDAVDIGLKAKAFTQEAERSRAERYLKSANDRMAAAHDDLAKLSADARNAATGDEYVALGMAHLSFGEFPKAVEALKAGIAKGGLKNAVDAQMTLGTAQLRAGNKADAVKTFRAVETDNQVTQRLAKFWALHATSN